MLNADNALGVTLYGNGGMNTNYPTQTFYDESSDATGVNMAQLFLSINYSRKLNSDHSIGISGILAYQYFKAEGVTSFGNFSSNPAKLSNNGTDSGIGFGFKVGYMGTFAQKLHIGAQFQSKVFMSEFDEYAGLFAEQGDFDVPMNWTVGLAYDVSDQMTLAFDVKQIYYSGVAAVANPMDLMTNSPTDQMGNPNPNFQPLGTDDAWGFGWQDMTIYKVGLEYEMNTDWTLRGGFSYGKQPIPETEVLFNILAPGVMESHLAFGIGKKLAGGNSIDFYLNYAFTKNVTGYNPLDFDPVQLQQGNFVPNQEIDLQMYQLDFGIGYSF
jgi:long-chain fatty acid transport protein